MAEQQASSSVSANKIGGHMFNDVKETDISIKKNILSISNKPSRCVAKCVDVDFGANYLLSPKSSCSKQSAKENKIHI
jgi:hypothetical protein